MRVLHIITRMNIGGTATYLINLLEGMIENGHEVLLVFGDVPENEKEDTRISFIPTTRVSEMSRRISLIKDVLAERKITAIIREFQPDIIHSHTFKAGLLSRMRSRTIPIVHSFHGHHLKDPEFGQFSRSVIIAVERFLAKRTSKLVTIGERVKEELLMVGIGLPSQYTSISPGINPPDLHPNRKMLEKFGLSKKKEIVLWMGRLTKVKRPDRALALAKRFPHVEFVIAGDGEMFNELNINSPQNCHLVGNQKAEELLSIADYFILTSESEGIPLSLLEAQMAGLPCIATNVGSVAEIISDHESGILTPNSYQGIEIALEECMSDSYLRSKISIQAREKSRLFFSRENMVNKHLWLYDDILVEERK